eukprot:1141268-Pelagomonas_calceolata.AAC.3
MQYATACGHRLLLEPTIQVANSLTHLTFSLCAHVLLQKAPRTYSVNQPRARVQASGLQTARSTQFLLFLTAIDLYVSENMIMARDKGRSNSKLIKAQALMYFLAEGAKDILCACAPCSRQRPPQSVQAEEWDRQWCGK